jgi:hypothetical protein
MRFALGVSGRMAAEFAAVERRLEVPVEHLDAPATPVHLHDLLIAQTRSIEHRGYQIPRMPPPLHDDQPQGDFGRRSAGDLGGQRCAVSVAEDHDLGPLAALGLADAIATFLVGENVPSAIASSQ